MNALFELIGSSINVEENEVDNYLASLDSLDGCTVEVKDSPLKRRKRILISPTVHSKVAKEFVDKVLFAKIYTTPYYDSNPRCAKLRSVRTPEDEIEFLTILSEIDYYDGYGSQELSGTIVFKDGTWLERWEYDGSEGWEKRALPTEEDIMQN